MSLKPVLSSLDEVEENLKGLYIEKDGKFRLDVDGGFKTHDEINGLTSALNKERDARNQLEKQVKQFEGIKDPAEALKALETIKNIDDKKLMDAGKVDELKAEIQKAMQEKLDKKQEIIDQLQGTVKEKEKTLHNELIGGRFARSEFIKEKLAILPDFVEARFGRHFMINEDGKVVARDGDGKEIYSKENPGSLADFDEALSILVDTHPDRDRIKKGSNATGAGFQGGKSGLYGVDWHKMSPTERLNAARKVGKT
jgi:hypothetical protein